MAGQVTCRDPEGWGPVSRLRQFDLTPCFEEGVVLSSLLVVFAVLYGAISGGVVGMQSAGTFALTDPRDMGKVGARLGMACFAAGLALLVGTPIAGVILGGGGGGEDDTGPMRWTGVIGFTADLLLVGAGFLFVTVWLVFRAAKRRN